MKIGNTSVIVTGGASGLGKSTARLMASMGARVALFDLPGSRGSKLAQELSGLSIPLDVTSESEVKDGVQAVKEHFGSISVCVNCAGIAAAASTLGKTGPHDYSTFKRVVDVNLCGTYNMIRVVSAAMQQNSVNEHGERGVIINTASIAATDGQRGQAAYAASKAGVAGLTLPVARDLGKFGIRVNAVAPGIFDTAMLQGVSSSVQTSLLECVVFPKRLGKPEEFAELVRFLIECTYMNGEVVRIDGGIRLPFSI